MNRDELVGLIQKQAGERLTKGQINAVLAALPHVAAQELAAGREVSIFNLCTIRVRKKPARQAHDFSTGQMRELPACRYPSISFGSAIKDALK